MTRNRALMLMVACLLVAAILRLPSLTEVPPGLHYDEAANAILAGDIGLRGDRPVFISSYTGKEPLFFYLAGGLTLAIGESVFALRLTSAFIGLLTIAVTFWLGKEMLADRRIAIIAAALLAISFWHLVFSRLGFRVISQPLLQGLALAFLFRGLKRSQLLPCLLGGAFLGLAAYTYLAVRIFPLLLLLSLPPLFLSRSKLRLRVTQLALFGVAALAVCLPLLLYFYQHPDAFWVRLGQAGPGSASASLLESYLRSLGMLFLLGDPYWRFNIPGRALFNWLWGGLLVAGWLILLLRWRRWWYDWQKMSVLMLLLTPLVMILPTALAVNEIVPSNLRAMGMIPFVFFLPAVGLVFLLEQVANLLRRPNLPLTIRLQQMRLLEAYEINYAFVVLVILLAGGAATWQLYFNEWATRSDLFYETDSDLVRVAAYLNEQPPDHPAIYLAALHYRHPTVAYLAEDYESIKWLPESQALVFPTSGPALIVYPHSSPAPDWAGEYLPTPEAGPLGPDGEHTYFAYRIASTPPISPTRPVSVNFGDKIELLGYSLEEGQSGAAIPLTLFWRVQDRPAEPFQLFVHLEDERGYRWSQLESFAYPAEQWAPGETIIQRVELPVPAGIPPGNYRLRLGYFNAESGARLPRLDEQGRFAGDSYLIEPVAITSGPPPSPLPTPPWGRPTLAQPGLHLLGYERNRLIFGQGETLDLALWWQATERQPDMTIRLELVGPDGDRHTLQETTPAQGDYPFSSWQPSEFTIDRIDPQIPPDLPPGQYTLEMSLLNEAGETAFSTELGAVTVEETVRNFSAPALSHPSGAVFGDEVALLGYDLVEITPNNYRLTLVWQALAQPAEDYTVFVHLLGVDGVCCVWQADSQPAQGSSPTSGWLPGEVVVDSYDIVIPPGAPPGAYPMEIGLYMPETGLRLVVQGPGMADSDALLLDPIVVSP